VEDALALVHAADIQDRSSRRDYQKLSGTAMALRGDRHGAVRQFLEAAMETEEALARIVEMELLDHAVQQLLGEVP
jgi:predicted negative regulator of RcsB-dependent stress response